MSDAKTAKLIRMLGASDGEAQNALLILRNMGTNFNDLAERTEDATQKKYSDEEMKEFYAQGLADGEKRARSTAAVSMRVVGVDGINWLRAAQELMKLHQDGVFILSEKEPYNELRFVTEKITEMEFGMTELSPKVKNWLTRLCAKAGVKAYE